MQKFIMLVGLPGSGKSTYADNLCAKTYDCIRLSSDAIRDELYGSEGVQGSANEVFSLLHKRVIDELVAGHSVVYDATNLSRKNRRGIIERVQSLSKKFCSALPIEVECHIIWAPIEVCIDRAEKRERVVSSQVILRMLNTFQAPFYDEGFDRIYLVNNVDNFDCNDYTAESLDRCRISHDNPHHKLNILEHCFAAEFFAKSNNYSNSLCIAAKYHDIGKPYVKAFIDSRGNISDTAHYYQHQCVSAWISYGLTEVFSTENQTYVPWLISTHMDPFLHTKYYNRLNSILQADINLLHQADVAAH